MIYKLICAALLISCGEALKIPAVVSRRTAITQAASIALPMVASPAFALNRAEDADIYKRADEGKLSAERALERAKKDDLVDGSSATCDELDKLIAVDRETSILFESLNKAGALDADEKVAAKSAQDKLKKQVGKLNVRKKEKGCGESEVLDSKAVLERARKGGLKDDFVIARAKQGEMLDPSKAQATCTDLAALQRVDDKAMIKVDTQVQALKKKLKQLEKDGDQEALTKVKVEMDENKLLLKRISSAETGLTNAQLQAMCTY